MMYVLDCCNEVIHFMGLRRDEEPDEKETSAIVRWLEYARAGSWIIGDLPILEGDPDERSYKISSGFCMVNAVHFELLGDRQWKPWLEEKVRLAEYVRVLDYMVCNWWYYTRPPAMLMCCTDSLPIGCACFYLRDEHRRLKGNARCPGRTAAFLRGCRVGSVS